MMVSMKSILINASKEQYAIGLFNIMNLEWAKAILEIHQEKNIPVILGVSEKATKYMGGFNTVSNMITGLIKDLNITVPVLLMLDHGSYEACQNALDAGFSSVMFDGSGYPIDENVKLTTSIVKRAHEQGALVEAEVGIIGNIDDGIINYGKIASPKDCVRIMATGVDILAPGIGNMHGNYPANWNGLNFDVLIDIRKAIGDLPIALHGGSGIPDEQIKKAISLGVAKVNISTELQMCFTRSIKQYFGDKKDLTEKGFDPRDLLGLGVNAIKSKVDEKLQLFGMT